MFSRIRQTKRGISRKTLVKDKYWRISFFVRFEKLNEAKRRRSNKQCPRKCCFEGNPKVLLETTWDRTFCFRIYAVRYSRERQNSKELTVRQGELVEVLDNAKNWWKVENFRSESGFVPKNLLEDVKIEERSGVRFHWRKEKEFSRKEMKFLTVCQFCWIFFWIFLETFVGKCIRYKIVSSSNKHDYSFTP